MGLDEAVTFSLVPDELIVPLDPRPGRGTAAGRAFQPSREANLRQSLVPSLLAARAYNEAHGVADAALFEIAPVYLPRPGTGTFPTNRPVSAWSPASTSPG